MRMNEMSKEIKVGRGSFVCLRKREEGEFYVSSSFSIFDDMFIDQYTFPSSTSHIALFQ